MLKRFLQSGFVRGMAVRLAAFYIKLVWATSRWQVVNGAQAEQMWQAKTPVILAFWHGRLLMMPKSWPGTSPIAMLISRHRDGELIASTIARFGFGSIRGSSPKPGKKKDKGGAAALMDVVKAARGGMSIGITPDGPRGPRMRASDGIVAIARLTGLPVLPAAYGIKGRKTLSSWDRFVVPLPFSRGVFVWGAPIAVARDLDEAGIEAARDGIETALNHVTREADRLTGHETPAPGDVPLPPSLLSRNEAA